MLASEGLAVLLLRLLCSCDASVSQFGKDARDIYQKGNGGKVRAKVERDGPGLSIEICERIPGFHELASDNKHNWRYRGHVPWKHVGPLLLSWFEGQRGPIPKASQDDDPNYDLAERLRLTRKYHQMFGSNKVFWRVMAITMEEEIAEEEQRLAEQKQVRALHKGKAGSPRATKAG